MVRPFSPVRRKQEPPASSSRETQRKSSKRGKQSKLKRDVEEIQRLSSAECHELVISHFDSSRRLAWSFLNRWHIRLEEDEVTSLTGASLCDAAKRFNPDLGVSFRTYLFYYLRGALLKEIARRVEDQKHYAALEDISNGETLPQIEISSDRPKGPEELMFIQQLGTLLDKASSSLDALEKEVVMRSVLGEESIVEIAEALGYCRCHISRVRTRALAYLAVEMREHIGSGDSDPSEKLPKKRRGGRGRRREALSIDPGAAEDSN